MTDQQKPSDRINDILKESIGDENVIAEQRLYLKMEAIIDYLDEQALLKEQHEK